MPGVSRPSTYDVPVVSEEVGEIDARILDELVRDARLSWRELGERVGLSPTAVADRVRNLRRRGVLRAYRAEVDPGAFGRDLRAVVDVELPPSTAPDEFEARLRQRPEVCFAAYVTGRADYSIIVDCAGAEGLDEFVRWLKRDAGAATTESKIVLRAVGIPPPTHES